MPGAAAANGPKLVFHGLHGSSPIAFPKGVERWRKPLQKIADWVPVDFLLAWIHKESSGRPDAISPLGERGLFQVHEAEIPHLNLTKTEFQRLTQDPGLALRTGVKQAKLYAKFAKRFLADVGVRWHGADFWKLVKLHHAAFAMPKYTLQAFYREKGRGPATWDELMGYVLTAVREGKDFVPGNPKLSDRLRRLAEKVFRNADEVGGVVPVVRPQEVAVLQRILPVA